jgi:hypothetical protein
MQSLPLPTGCTGLKASPKFRQELRNVYAVAGEKPTLSIRPGVDGLGVQAGKCRGMGLYRNNTTGDEELYAVFGTRLLKIVIDNALAEKKLTAADLAITDIGEIPASGECILIGGFTKLLIMQVGGDAFVYDGTTLDQITDPQYLPSVSCDYEAGRFVFVPSDGSPMFWSDLDNPASIQPENYADAEREPDPNKAVIKIKDTVFLLGTRSIQRLRYRAGINTYVAEGGESAAVGYVGGLTRFGENYAFVGQGTNGGFDIYAFGQAPQAISNDFVSELINSEYSLRDIENMRAEYAVIEGTPILIFYFPRHTLAFANGGWSFWHSDINGQRIGTWDITHLQYAYGFIFSGDEDGTLGALRDSGNEYGEDIEWLMKTYIRTPQDDRMSLRRIALGVTMGMAGIASVDAQGKGDKASQVGMSLSRDGVLFGTAPAYRSMGPLGDYGRGMFWGGPIGSSRDGLSIIFNGYGNADMTIDGVWFE